MRLPLVSVLHWDEVQVIQAGPGLPDWLCWQTKSYFQLTFTIIYNLATIPINQTTILKYIFPGTEKIELAVQKAKSTSPTCEGNVASHSQSIPFSLLTPLKFAPHLPRQVFQLQLTPYEEFFPSHDLCVHDEGYL